MLNQTTETNKRMKKREKKR